MTAARHGSERFRILAAATALGEFTPGQLAAYSGANENTVQSVLSRNARHFSQVEPRERPGTPGRPPNHFKVIDVDDLRAELKTQEQTFTNLETTTAPDSSEDRLAAIVVAENALIKAWNTPDPAEGRSLAMMATKTLLQAREERTEEVSDDLDRRAINLGIFAELLIGEADGKALGVEDVSEAWRALGELEDVVPRERWADLRLSLLQAILGGEPLPPMVLLMDEGSKPVDVMQSYAADTWIRLQSFEAGKTMWAQEWAEPLLDSGLLVGVIVQSADDLDQLRESLADLPSLLLPAFVLSHHGGDLAAAKVLETGAFYVPALAGMDLIAKAVRETVERLGVRAFEGTTRARRRGPGEVSFSRYPQASDAPSMRPS